MTVGYFARPSIANQGARWTMTHIVSNNKVLCGYKPHKTMDFQWNGDAENIVAECGKCSDIFWKEKERFAKNRGCHDQA